MARATLFPAALVAAALICACSSSQRPSPTATPRQQAPARLALDHELSPVPFRWLADDAVLVAPQVGKRQLASFGNYVGRAVQGFERARLSVWDDEAAWKVAAGHADGDEALAHKRAQYVKETSPPEPVDRYLVFSSQGEVVYQRDFRSWPLTEID